MVKIWWKKLLGENHHERIVHRTSPNILEGKERKIKTNGDKLKQPIFELKMAHHDYDNLKAVSRDFKNNKCWYLCCSGSFNSTSPTGISYRGFSGFNSFTFNLTELFTKPKSCTTNGCRTFCLLTRNWTNVGCISMLSSKTLNLVGISHFLCRLQQINNHSFKKSKSFRNMLEDT